MNKHKAERLKQLENSAVYTPRSQGEIDYCLGRAEHCKAMNCPQEYILYMMQARQGKEYLELLNKVA